MSELVTSPEPFPVAAPYRGPIGVARRDITPPDGIAVRNWGAAPHAVSSGVHRPLMVTALAVGADPLVLVAADLGWWRTHEDEWAVRGPLLDALRLDPDRLVLTLSHTHAGPSLHGADDGRPGWEAVTPYLERVAEAAAAAAAEAVAARAPGELTVTLGRCGLATDRDVTVDGAVLCGFNPAGEPDDTVLVARAVNGAGDMVATLVNYACHPTTLAWDNAKISPDWVGAMREVVEDATGGAPCLFLQGASGELAPLEQYVGDPAVADRLGRRLGHAVVAALLGLPAPGQRFELTGVVESGSTAAVWAQRPAVGSPRLVARRGQAALPLRETAERDWADLGERQAAERVHRARLVRRAVGPDPDTPVPYWLWQVGDAVLVAQPCEAYSVLQRELRARLAPHPVLVACLANGCTLGYLVPADRHDDRYQAWQSPFAPGALEQLVDAIEADTRALLTEGPQ